MLSKKNSKSNENLVIGDPEFPGFRCLLKEGRWFAQKRWMGIWWNVGAFNHLGYGSYAEASWAMCKEFYGD